MYFKLPAIREDVFIWLNDLESRMQVSDDGAIPEVRDGINALIHTYFPKLVDMNPGQSIKLVEQWFINSEDPNQRKQFNHVSIVDKNLKDNTDLIYKYLYTFLKDKDAVI